MIDIRRAGLALAAFVAVAATATLTEAKVYSIPADNPVATVNFPDDWSPDTFDTGVEGTSADDGIYISVEAVKANDIASAVEDTVKSLSKDGLVVDTSTQHATDSSANGMKIHDYTYKAKDKDGPTNFDITLIETNVPDEFVMLSYWGSDEAAKANDKALGDIAQSIQLTK